MKNRELLINVFIQIDPWCEYVYKFNCEMGFYCDDSEYQKCMNHLSNLTDFWSYFSKCNLPNSLDFCLQDTCVVYPSFYANPKFGNTFCDFVQIM